MQVSYVDSMCAYSKRERSVELKKNRQRDLYTWEKRIVTIQCNKLQRNSFCERGDTKIKISSQKLWRRAATHTNILSSDEPNKQQFEAVLADTAALVAKKAVMRIDWKPVPVLAQALQVGYILFRCSLTVFLVVLISQKSFTAVGDEFWGESRKWQTNYLRKKSLLKYIYDIPKPNYFIWIFL